MYLFLDLEWQQSNPLSEVDPEDLLQIACIWVDEKFEKEKKFFRIVRPKNIDIVTDKTLQMLHLGRNVIEQAQSLENVMNKWRKTIPSYEVIVVWNKYTLELFNKTIASCLNIKLIHKRVVILQELLPVINQNSNNKVISFKKAMQRYHVSYQTHLLHCAKHDVQYLKKLFNSIKYTYKQKYIEHAGSIYFYRLVGSNIIHMQECHYIQGKKQLEKKVANVEDLFKGYQLCRHCQNNAFVKQILLDFEREANNNIGQFSEEYIKRLCKQYHMKCDFSHGVIWIRTYVSRWRIYHNENKVTEVYHENYKQAGNILRKKRLKYSEGFHKQTLKLKKYRQVIEYIYYHDQKFFTRKNDNQQRIEQLFEKI